MKKELTHHFKTCGHLIENGGIEAEVEQVADRMVATNTAGNVLFNVSTNLYRLLSERGFVKNPHDPWAQYRA